MVLCFLSGDDFDHGLSMGRTRREELGQEIEVLEDLAVGLLCECDGEIC